MSDTRRESAIVTGGGGGIGAVVSRRLAQSGYHVVVADADRERVDAAVDGLGEGHRGFVGDLTSAEPNARLVRLAQGLAPIGLVVNAIGISPKGEGGRKLSIAETGDELWDSVMAVNLRAPFLLIREASPVMPTDGTANIVNVLSIAARMGAGGSWDAPFPPHLPSAAVYAASKAALQSLTASAARELAPLRIRVNGVAPGFVATPMMAAVPSEQGASLAQQVPLGRFALPEEIADAIEFLASPRAAYITGASLDVNGGWQTC